MNEKFFILAGLVTFLLAVSFPFWQSTEVEVLPQIAMQTKGEQCVAPVEYMRKNHMKLLDTWRDSVVRDGERFHIMPDGSKVEKSLTKTCLDCHVSKEKFCEECHSYVNVKPYCWECHVTPKSGGHTELSGIDDAEENRQNLLNNLLARNQPLAENNQRFKEGKQ